MKQNDFFSGVGLFHVFNRLYLAISHQVQKNCQSGIRNRASRLTACLVCLLGMFLRSAAVGAEPAHEFSINQDAGCGGWFEGGWLTVKLRLETGEEVAFMVDTGSPVTVLDDSLKSKLGKQVGAMPLDFAGSGRQPAGVHAAPKLFLGDIPLFTTNDYVLCTPLKKKFKKHYQGILGMDCLADYCIQLDFVAGKMRFLDSARTNAAAWGKMYPLIISRTGPRQELLQPLIHQAGFFGNNTNLIIDTGCHADGLVSQGETGQVIGAWLLSFFGCGRFHSGVWDGERYSNIQVAPVGHENVLGLRFLARHLVTLDFPNQKMYLKQTSVAPLKIRKPRPS